MRSRDAVQNKPIYCNTFKGKSKALQYSLTIIYFLVLLRLAPLTARYLYNPALYQYELPLNTVIPLRITTICSCSAT